MVIVRLLFSHLVMPATFVSVLVNVISHDTLELALTFSVVLFDVMVRAAAVVAPASGLLYSCPLIAEPVVTPQLSSV